MNDRDRRFCEEYMIDLDAKHAAIRAGYAVSTARTAAEWIKPENPKKPGLRAEIDRMMAERSRKTGISAERVVRELARIAFADITNVVNKETGEVLADANRDDAAAIASVKVKEGEITEREVRMYDKNRALELLGKHLGLFTDNVKLQVERPVIVDDVKD